jgi:two-component system sensor histidine kinase HydH
MFRVKESEATHGFSLAERVVQVTLLVALLANFGSVYLILQEQRRLSAWPDGPEAIPAALGELRQDAELRLASGLVVSAILVLCLAAMWWLRRRSLSSQKSLRQVKMLAHDILASMDRGVVTTDLHGIITSINSAGIRLLEVDFECVGRPLASISPPACGAAGGSLVDVYREVVEGRAAVLDRDFNVGQAGRVLRLRVDGHALEDTEGKALGCVVHLRDVTERMLLEERMRRMERFLSLATLASGLHHEIKNPLTALSIHIQLLEESLSDGDTRQAGESVDELVGVLKTEVCRLNGVLESFRSFAHLQRLALQPTDALGVVENAIRLIRPQAAEQRVQITLLHPEQELPRVPLDADKFEQAVLNLVINALEAMPEGGTLTISATAVDGEFRVSVQDSGSGIPPEVQKNLFRPYFSTKTQGSGMGLALSEKLIGQHGGRISYRTGPEGSTFDITVPLEQRGEVA